MAKKQVITKIVLDAKVCEPKYVKKAKQYAITQFDSSGKQIIHWEGTQESAQKKYLTLKG